VTRALHKLELVQQAGPLDEGEMSERARALIPDRYGLQGAALCVATSCGPRQQILRPAQLEEPALERDLHREVLLGDQAVFDTTEGVKARIEGQAIVLEQPGAASLLVDALGSVRLVQPGDRFRRFWPPGVGRGRDRGSTCTVAPTHSVDPRPSRSRETAIGCRAHGGAPVGRVHGLANPERAGCQPELDPDADERGRPDPRGIDASRAAKGIPHLRGARGDGGSRGTPEEGIQGMTVAPGDIDRDRNRWRRVRRRPRLADPVAEDFGNGGPNRTESEKISAGRRLAGRSYEAARQDPPRRITSLRSA
jgi:hypothetical protein